MASVLGQQGYTLEAHKRTSVQIYQEIERVYAVFHWGAPPLSRDEIGIATALTYEEARLLATAPSTGAYSIAKLIAIAGTTKDTLPSLDAMLKHLASFDVRGPDSADTYLGVRWDAMLVESTPSDV